MHLGPGVALRYESGGPGIDPRSLGIFSGASDSSMCPGVDSASKNEYQDIPGGKDGHESINKKKAKPGA